jgi:hypothetical protein
MKNTLKFLIVFLSFTLIACKTNNVSKDSQASSNNIESGSDLHLDENMLLVKGQCTGCHSTKLITMNRFTREGWQDKIRWMQKTQNLWDLGEAEPAILDYLTKYYSPEPKNDRRANLENIEWYNLEN